MEGSSKAWKDREAMHSLGSLWGEIPPHPKNAGKNLGFRTLSPKVFVIRTTLCHMTLFPFVSVWGLRDTQGHD